MTDKTMLAAGLTAVQTETVTKDKTAGVVGSGEVEVYATPAMITLMESVSHSCVKEFLEEGQSTVGSAIAVKHISATPLGMTVTAECTLVEIDNKRLVFEVKAFDAAGLIGEGSHERFIINKERFIERANTKNEI